MAAISTVFAPSLVLSTKSLPAASDTDRFTVRAVVAVALRVTVKLAAAPSVTAEPPEMVTVGPVLLVRTWCQTEVLPYESPNLNQ